MKRTTPHVLALLLAVLAFACGSSQRAGEDAPSGPGPIPASAKSGPPVVVGTVLEAASGQPVAGATVTGPNGATAETDADGRFRLKGLSAGDGGTLKAVGPAGLEGQVKLRPLAGGRLEVVLHLR